jgi:hypothetical protein
MSHLQTIPSSIIVGVQEFFIVYYIFIVLVMNIYFLLMLLKWNDFPTLS